jgi:Zn-dependent peptidase ImmA (M78 family)
MVEDNQSYTINKKIIHLCTKDPRNGKTYDKNTLMFVVLHELAHVLCPDVGHTDTFSRINNALLQHAVKYGFYDPSKPFVENYCKIV